MNYESYLHVASEIKELESLLTDIPAENILERIGLEARLEDARRIIENVSKDSIIYKARLTFRGKPVLGSHGIAADFASNATGFFAEAVAAIAAGLSDNLRYMGPIPDRQINQLLITGIAIGSFGFEFELPTPDSPNLFPERSKVEVALQKVQDLLCLAADGNDDDIAELVDEIHPRAVAKVSEFLDYLGTQDAWCGIEFKDKFFQFQDVDQLRSSAIRLKEDNIKEQEESYSGEFQGVLPKGRTFEFKLSDQSNIIKGKVGLDILDADVLNIKYLHKPVNVKLDVIQFGQGRPRYTLKSLDKII